MNKIACDPKFLKGRFFKEEESKIRSPFQTDRDRIIHSSAFRRLKHKTQVFVEHEGDHYRTRLTHTLEVSQVARTISNVLKINSDLTEAIALAHDLGHTPFGHIGEDTLNDCMQNYGGFSHNLQTLRVVTLLEKSHADFDGLNLTWETLDGMLKHNGPLMEDEKSRYSFFEMGGKFDLSDHSSLEGQVAAISDDIAYHSHDLDDGIRAKLFKFEEIVKLPIIDEAYRTVRKKYPNENKWILQKETIRHFFNDLVLNVIMQTRENLDNLFSQFSEVITVDHIRKCKRTLVNLSDRYLEDLKTISDFLFEKMYRHEKVNRLRKKAKVVVYDLFQILTKNINLMPKDWVYLIENSPNRSNLHLMVADYLSGMTDRYAIQEHSRLTGLQIFP